MARVGRPPKSNVVKLVSGNPGKRKLRPDPIVEMGAPNKPEWFSEEASAEWDRVVPGLVKQGVLAKQDRSMLSVYCHVHSRVIAYAIEGKDPPPSLVAQHRGLAASFGLEPAARVRVKAVAPQELANPWDDV